jgi:hypothetical protein
MGGTKDIMYSRADAPRCDSRKSSAGRGAPPLAAKLPRESKIDPDIKTLSAGSQGRIDIVHLINRRYSYAGS